MKTLHKEEYRGYELYISGKYINNYYDWHEKDTSAVRLDYEIWNLKGNPIKIDPWHSKTIAKKNSFRILFWTIKPKISFQEQVEEGISEVIDYIKERLDELIYEQEMTDGLLESLKKVK